MLSRPWMTNVAFPLRISLGIIFSAVGALMILVLAFTPSSRYFDEYGPGAWVVFVIAFVQLVGGICLLSGLFVRAASALLALGLAGALLTQWPNGLNAERGGLGWRILAILLTALVAQVILGPGARCPVRRPQEKLAADDVQI